MRTLSLLAMVFALVAQQALADQPAIGTRFHPSTGGYFEVEKIEDGDVMTVNAGGRQGRWLGGFMGSMSQASPEDRARIRAMQPLEPGQFVSFDTSNTTVHGGNAAFNHQIRVLRQETVAVKAGRFDTFVIEWRERNIGQLAGRGSPGEFIRTYYYAPKLGFIVKFDYREEGFTVPANVKPWELREVSRARPTASTQPPANRAPAPTAAKKLEDLQSLRDSGLITPAEYEAKRKEIVDKL
jgi:hypothetical protein